MVVIYKAVGSVHDECRVRPANSLVISCRRPSDNKGEKELNRGIID